MIIDKQEFIDRVKKLYVSSPGATANIAYHKLEGLLQDSKTYLLDEAGRQCLYALREQQLIFYWSNQKEQFLVPPAQLAKLNFLVLNADYYAPISDFLPELTAVESYPLFYDQALSQPLANNDRYIIEDFNFASESDYLAAADIITGTGAGYQVTADRVRGWLQDTAFDPSLWLLAKEKQSGRPVGVGISAYYEPLQEADLDWFFVDPAHQRQGIGRMLIAATIERCQPQAKVIRLSGIADGFYQKCGFRAGDRWLIIS